jgi:hypothetical protein
MPCAVLRTAPTVADEVAVITVGYELDASAKIVVRRSNACVEDIDVESRGVVAICVRVIERQVGLVDPIETPVLWGGLCVKELPVAVGLDVENLGIVS